MKRLFVIMIGLLSVSTIEAAEYNVGQIWKYQTRENESSSQIYIVRIDTDKKLINIYHIYVDGVKIKNPYIDGGI